LNTTIDDVLLLVAFARHRGARCAFLREGPRAPPICVPGLLADQRV